MRAHVCARQVVVSSAAGAQGGAASGGAAGAILDAVLECDISRDGRRVKVGRGGCAGPGHWALLEGDWGRGTGHWALLAWGWGLGTACRGLGTACMGRGTGNGGGAGNLDR